MLNLSPNPTPRAPLRRGAPLGERIHETLELLQRHVQFRRRILHAGERVYRSGERFGQLHLIHSGFFKTVHLSVDGREQLGGLHFKGDWLGFDGIAHGEYGCDALAMDTGEVWSMDYAELLSACASEGALLQLLHSAMSGEIRRERESMVSLCTLPAVARVADFLRNWAEAQAQRGLGSDQILLRLTRAEIGSYLGMTLESVSRALSRLARGKLIAFAEKGRREVQILDHAALAAYIECSQLEADGALLQ